MVKVELQGSVGSPPTRAIMIVCELAGIPYEIKFRSPMVKSPEFKKLNPAQQIPILVDDGFVLPESRAIMVYLLEKYAKDDSLYPKDLKARAVINARLNFDNGTFWPRLLTAAYPVFMGGKTSEEANKSLTDAVSAIEEFLTRDKWVAGSKMTVADISISTTMLTLLKQYSLEIDMTKYPKISSWLEELNKIEVLKKLNEEGFAAFKALLAEMGKSQGKK